MENGELNPPAPVTPGPVQLHRGCKGQTKTGKLCNFTPVAETTFCKWHNPNTTAEEKYKLHSAAGKARLGIIVRKPKSKADILNILSDRMDIFLKAVGTGTGLEVEPTIFYMAKVYAQILCMDEPEAMEKGTRVWRMTGTR